jgi:hypothetical protein
MATHTTAADGSGDKWRQPSSVSLGRVFLTSDRQYGLQRRFIITDGLLIDFALENTHTSTHTLSLTLTQTTFCFV